MSRWARPELWMYFRPKDTCRRRSFSSSSENSSPWASFIMMASWRLPPDLQNQIRQYNKTKHSDFSHMKCQLTITILVLNNHVIIFGPCWIVADNVRVMSKNCVSVNLLQCQLSGEVKKADTERSTRINSRQIVKVNRWNGVMFYKEVD